jgi:predicted MarR family transcription regulator
VKKRERVVRCKTLSQLIGEPPHVAAAAAHPGSSRKLSPRAARVLAYLRKSRGPRSVGQICKMLDLQTRHAGISYLLLDLSTRGLIDVLDGDLFRASQ